MAERLHRLFMRARLGLVFCAMLTIAACTPAMADQPRYEPLEPSILFRDGSSARPLPAGSVPIDGAQLDTHFYTGRVDNVYVDSFPFPVDAVIIARGQERYDIFCAPCHGITGTGNGMIAQRSDRLLVPSFHQERLRQAPEGLYFEVITNGYRYMYGYGSRIPEEDRWAIIAYIRVLQRSRNANLADVPADDRPRLERERP